MVTVWSPTLLRANLTTGPNTSGPWRCTSGGSLPGVYDYLESQGIDYAIRLPANQILQQLIAHLLKAKVEWHRGELFPRVGFIVTNTARRSWNVVGFYN